MEKNSSCSGRIVALIGFIASLIGIFVFFSGRSTFSDVVGYRPPATTTVSEGRAVDLPTGGNPPQVNSPPSTADSSQPSEFPWRSLVDPLDMPPGVLLESDGMLSNEAIAQSYDDHSADMLRQLDVWQRVTGYYAHYVDFEADRTCLSPTGLSSIGVSVDVHRSGAGADGYLEFQKAVESGSSSLAFVDETDAVGENAFYKKYEPDIRCIKQDGSNYDWHSFSLVFRRSNALVSVHVLGASRMSFDEQEQLAVRLAQLIDSRLILIVE